MIERNNMDKNQSMSKYVLSIAKKANKSIDINKVKELQKKMTKISLPIIFVGVIVLVVGLVLMFILPRKGDTINVYGSIVVIIGAVINAIGVFYYLTAKQLDFDGGMLESVDTGKHCPKCGEICSETADYCEKCGARLLNSKRCTACQSQNEEDAEYCTNCGKKLN